MAQLLQFDMQAVLEVLRVHLVLLRELRAAAAGADAAHRKVHIDDGRTALLDLIVMLLVRELFIRIFLDIEAERLVGSEFDALFPVADVHTFAAVVGTILLRL